MRQARRLSLEQLAPYLLEVPDAHGPHAETVAPSSGESSCFSAPPVDWQAVFGNNGPLEIEVGFGKGLFLVTAAQTCPGVNYLGIEIVRKYQLFTATRLAKRGLGNVRLVKADARAFLRDHVASGSCQAVHVYFPDPWWKKRHLKRRVFTQEFVSQCARVLCSGGRLEVVTDVEEYFQLIGDLVAAQHGFRPSLSPEAHAPAHDVDYLTNFERKFRKEGRAIHRVSYENH